MLRKRKPPGRAIARLTLRPAELASFALLVS